MSIETPTCKAPLETQYTEVGALPFDWSVVPLISLAEKIMVGIASAATHAYRSSGVTMFRNQNIRPGVLDVQDVLYIDPQYEQTYKNKRLKAGDLLTARTGYPGTTSLVPQGFDGAQSFTTLITRPRSGSVDPRYLCLYINGRAGQKYFEQAQIGGGQKNVNAASLKLLPVAVPSKSKEQRAIADALIDAGALIDSLEQLLTKKRQIKQGTMHELLCGKRRLPGFSGDWGSFELRQLGCCIRGVAYNPSADLADGDTEKTVRLLRSNNVQGGGIVRTGLQFVDRRRVRSDQYLQVGDLLLCMANGSRDLVGKAGRYADVDEYRYTFGAFMGCYRPNPAAIDPEFVSFHFQTRAFRQHVDLLLAGSSINNLRPEGVLGFALCIPHDQTEQRAIANVLNECDAEVAALEARLTKARALKQAMAQALLTGRIRFTEANT